ncbi:hypothetical protein WICPIJ_000082 [Wickerhamomyces pijperi]|uniref:AB hydrolase-1 domain-containing protein n=1 Tax=Wickerhamomyces pijperi TaxID=599730 RepID=A0A9P8TSG4_WICPI|nr:hypothetical protein WICPIJ_000082 [Wickerhamomyces pijperi]
MGFRGIVEQHHAPITVKLPIKSTSNFKDNEVDTANLIPLDELVRTEVPELTTGSTFYLNPFLFNGDLQTLYLNAADYSKTWSVQYGRRIVEYNHDGCLIKGGSSSADFVLPFESREEFKAKSDANPTPEGWPKQHPGIRFLTEEEISEQTSDDTKPLAIVCHGLGGGSHEPIIRCLTSSLFAKGFEVVVLNSRGCSRTKLSTPELFYGLQTDDLRQFVKELRASYPNRPFYGVGFSFGATILTNYLGEEGAQSDFVASATLSNPWDMVDSSYHLTSRFISRQIFVPAITDALTRLVKSNRAVLMQNEQFSEDKVHAKYHSPPEFDSTFTAPIYGFGTAFDYYRTASSVNRLLSVQTPMLIINSTDDPVVGVVSIPVAEAEVNPFLILAKTNIGGHLGYLQYDLKSSWSVDRIVDFFVKFEEIVDVSKKPETDYTPSVPILFPRRS